MLLLGCLISFTVSAQSNLETITTILQTHCTTGCHSGGSPSGNLDLSGTAGDVYMAIVGTTPTNPAAASAGYQLIAPGYPERSFLLKKLIHNLDASDTLSLAEGDPMPSSGSGPSQAEIELIRQWIIQGSDSTGAAVNYQIVQDYYNGEGLPRMPRPAAPDPSEGFQIHLGPILIGPGTEIEYFKKHDLQLTTGVEVTRIANDMNDESHHFILYKYNDTFAATLDDGLRNANFGAVADININASSIATWQFPRDHALPTGTAYKWQPGTFIDLNYHIRNYNPDSVLAAEVYLNVYTQPLGTAQHEMFSGLASYGDANPFLLNVLNNSTDTTFVMEQFNPSSNETYKFWIIQSHTHSLGVDFDIYKRNVDGTKGDQIYEGFFNDDYSFNQGFYDWEHPAVREYSPMLEIDMSEGLIHEATYNNSGSSPVGFGLTTEDEMFVTYFQYTREVNTSVEDIEPASASFELYPNPANDKVNIWVNLKGSLKNYSVKVTNLLGAMVNKLNVFGNGKEEIDISHLEPGVYLVQVEVYGQTEVKKFVKQ